jgi:hypothetical protein
MADRRDHGSVSADYLVWICKEQRQNNTSERKDQKYDLQKYEQINHEEHRYNGETHKGSIADPVGLFLVYQRLRSLYSKVGFTIEWKLDPKATAEPTTPPKLKIAQK